VSYAAGDWGVLSSGVIMGATIPNLF
jgi:hypothetical protein